MRRIVFYYPNDKDIIEKKIYYKKNKTNVVDIFFYSNNFIIIKKSHISTLADLLRSEYLTSSVMNYFKSGKLSSFIHVGCFCGSWARGGFLLEVCESWKDT